jgi:hypothetical protein
MILTGDSLSPASPGFIRIAARGFVSGTDANADRHCNALLPMMWTFADGLEDLLRIVRGDFGAVFRFFIRLAEVDQCAAGNTEAVRRQLDTLGAQLLNWDLLGR